MNVEIRVLLDIVNEFIAKSRGPKLANANEDTLLLQGGLLNSFALTELICELEQRLDVSLPDGTLLPEDFESVQALHRRLAEVEP